MKNHGVKIGTKKTDWVAGTIPHQVRNPSGDWRPYVVKGEQQIFTYFDSMACVSFATNNSCEMQIKQQTGQEVNFSDRFLAKMSGTTPLGNYVYIVLDTWRHYGCVNEEEWPAPPQGMKFLWADYYGDIPQFIIDRAAGQSLDKYDLQYEQITDLSANSIKHHLKHAPLLITLPGHEVAGTVVSADNTKLTYFDSYDPYLKTINISNIDFIYKAVLTVKGNQMSQIKTQGKGPSRRIILEAADVSEWLALCKIYGKDPSSVEETVN